MIQSEILNQAGRKVQRMRNILVILAMFVCTSICLGGQEITVNGDIGVRAGTMKLEHDARIAARKKKEEAREAEWAKERAEWEKKLWAQRKRDKLELEREEKLRAEERAVSRVELDKYEASRSDHEQRVALYKEMRAEERATQRVWTVSRAELDKYEAERYKEPQAKKEWYGKWAQLRKERAEERAQRKERGKLKAKLWRDKPLSELEKQLVDREKRLVDQKNYYSGWGGWWNGMIMGSSLNLTLEWEELLAAREELDKRLAEERATRMKEEEEVCMKKLEEWEKEKAEEREKLALSDLEQTMKEGKQIEQWFKLLKQAGEAVYPDIAGNGIPNSDPDKYKHGKALTDDDGNAIWNNPNNNSLTIKPGVKVGDVFGAKMNKASVDKNKGNNDFLSMKNNEVIVSGGEFGCGNTNGDIAGAWADDDIAADLMNVSSNTVRITGGNKIGNVYGGRAYNGTVSSSTVRITGGSNIKDVYGGCAYNRGTVSSNTVRIEGGTVQNVYGGRIMMYNGTATGNEVNLTNVAVKQNVYGAMIGDGLASSNTVTITGGIIGVEDDKRIVNVGNVYGGYIEGHGTATGNTVIINGGEIEGNVFGGYIEGDGKAINNTITITGSPKFSSYKTILCGGVCCTHTNDAFTGNTLNIVETKKVVVKGISNFENYNFYLPAKIKFSEPILVAMSGDCIWDAGILNADVCTETRGEPVDLENSKIRVYNRRANEIDKSTELTLIYCLFGFKEPIQKVLEFNFDDDVWVEYKWELVIVNKQYLKARLIAKEPGSTGKLVAGGYGTLLGLVNQGTDFVVSRIEEAERLVGGGEGEIEAFFGVGANKSRYNTGTEIEMVGTSMIGGIAIGMEVGGKGQSPKGQSPKELVTGVFVEHGNGDSEIICEKKSKGSNEYTGVGVLGKYNLYEDEERGRKVYGEAVLRAGCVSNKFKGNGLKDDRGKELEYEAGMMYEGCAGGLGYKHKVSEKIDLDWSLRYMFGRQDGKDVTMSDGRIVKFENVISNRIKVGVRGTYRDIEQIKPYVGIWYEHELGGKIKAVVQDAQDQVKIPASSFGGVTGIGELGASGKVWKFGVDISGQGYLGVRKGFGGMLKLKYAFGKDAHGSKASSLASSKAPRS